MDGNLKLLIIKYIDNINKMCIQLLDGLNLNTKEEFIKYIAKHRQIEYEVNDVKYILHGAGCIATNEKMFLDWDFGYGSRWCGINPWLLAETLERNNDVYVEYYDSNKIKFECEKAVITGEMYKKYNMYYFTTPINETFEPDFPREYDILIVEHYGEKKVIPRNKVVDRFIRKSRRVHNKIDESLDIYTLKFMLKGKEVYSIPYDDIRYPENAVRIMREILINTEENQFII